MRYITNSMVIGLLVRASLALGQELPKALLFDHLAIPGTIRSSEVNNMLQDPEGLLWFAGDGLFRYDGISFTEFKYLPDSTSIASKEINSLLYDKVKKRVLIATRNFGVVEFNYQSNSLHKLPSRDGVPFLNSLEQTADGKVWATSFTSGLFYLENDTLKRFTHKIFGGQNLTAPFALEDYLLVGHGPKIMFLRNNQIADSINLNWPNVNFTAYGQITAFAFDLRNKLYIGTEKQGVLIYDLRQKKFSKYFSPEQSPFYNRINRIFIDRQGLVWILTKSGGLVVYSPEMDEYQTFTKNPLSQQSIDGDNCMSIIQDKTGIIWIGSDGDLNKYDPNKVQITHITHNPFDKNSLTDRMVRGVFEDDNGNLMIGTDGGYINKLNLATQSIDHIKVSLPGYPGVIVPMYFANLDNNYILIGSNTGILRMHKRTGQISAYEPLQSLLKNRMIRQILHFQDKLYMISSGKLLVHDIQAKQTKEYNNFSSEKNQHVTNVTCLYLDSNKNIWLGVSKGISVMHPDHTFTHYEFEKKANRPAGSYFMVLSIEEINGKLWIGTFDSGLWQMDIPNGTDNPEIDRLGHHEALASNTVYATLADSENNVWISTNKGIYKFEAGQDRLIQFTTSEGVQDNEFNRLAFCKTTSGLLVFGGINGVNLFDPKKINLKSVITTPVILSISGNRQVEDDFFIDLREKQDNITLNADQNFITFRYVIPNYQQPPRFEAEYFLENYDVQWNASVNNHASYNNLKPGSYTFKVRVYDRDGIEHTSSVGLIVNPPFWQTWWFISLTVGVIFFAVYRLARGYASKALRDKKLLEELLNERTMEIEKSRAELVNLNQKKDLIFSILSHDLRGPLTTLKGFLSLLIDNTDTLPAEDIKKHASNIRNSVTSSLDLIDNTLFWSLSQTGNITYTPTHFLLSDTLKKIHRLYQLTADKKQIQFNFEVVEHIRIYGDENMLYVALRNIVSNALKYTPPGKKVYVDARENHQFAIIKVTDEGIGMSTDYIKKLISEEQPMLKVGTSNEKGTGLGLVLTKKFISLNKGELQISSIENKGTEFTIKLPLTTQA